MAKRKHEPMRILHAIQKQTAAGKWQTIMLFGSAEFAKAHIAKLGGGDLRYEPVLREIYD